MSSPIPKVAQPDPTQPPSAEQTANAPVLTATKDVPQKAQTSFSPPSYAGLDPNVEGLRPYRARFGVELECLLTAPPTLDFDKELVEFNKAEWIKAKQSKDKQSNSNDGQSNDGQRNEQQQTEDQKLLLEAWIDKHIDLQTTPRNQDLLLGAWLEKQWSAWVQTETENRLKAATIAKAAESTKYTKNAQQIGFTPPTMILCKVYTPDGQIVVDSRAHDYTKWNITKDPAVHGEEGKTFAYEFISPIITTGSYDQYDRAYALLKDFFDFISAKGCTFGSPAHGSMHVHVSPLTTEKLTIEFVKRAACAAYYFEPVIRALLPPTRQLRRKFVPEFRSPQLAFLFPFPEPDKRTWSKLGNAKGDNNDEKSTYVVNLSEKDVEGNLRGIMAGKCDNVWQVQSYVHDHLNPSKYAAWNFTYASNLENAATIEFRKPPPSHDLDSAMAWADFTISFVLAATQLGSSRLEETTKPFVAAQAASNSNTTTVQTQTAGSSKSTPATTEKPKADAPKSMDVVDNLLRCFEPTIEGLKKFLSISRPSLNTATKDRSLEALGARAADAFSKTGTQDALQKLFIGVSEAKVLHFRPEEVADVLHPRPAEWAAWQGFAKTQCEDAEAEAKRGRQLATRMTDELWELLQNTYPKYDDTLWRLALEKYCKDNGLVGKEADECKTVFDSMRGNDMASAHIQYAKTPFEDGWDSSCIDEIITDGDKIKAGTKAQTTALDSNSNTATPAEFNTALGPTPSVHTTAATPTTSTASAVNPAIVHPSAPSTTPAHTLGAQITTATTTTPNTTPVRPTTTLAKPATAPANTPVVPASTVSASAAHSITSKPGSTPAAHK